MGKWNCYSFMYVTLVYVMLGLVIINASNVPPDFEDKADEFVDTILACREIVGLTLTVVQGNGTLLAKGYGIKNRADGSKVDENTLFSIASLSKAFATTLLGIVLKESGKYNWETRVKDIIGEDFYFADEVRTSQATLRDLAAHRLGIPTNNYVRLKIENKADLARSIRFFNATLEYRNSYLYSNIMYGMLSYITEIIGGKTWEELMTEKIFTPLGMSSTTFTHVTDLTQSAIALPYLPDNGTMRNVSLNLHSDWGQLGGSGSIMSNSVDMAKYLKMQLNMGVSAETGEQVVPMDVIEETHKIVNVIEQRSSVKAYGRPNVPVTFTYPNYALGWRVGEYRGLRLISHTGTSWGYGALLIQIPDKNIAIYTGITGPDTDYAGRRNLQLYLIDLLLGETPWLNQTSACTFPSDRKRSQSTFSDQYQASLPLDDYIGTFGNFGYGNITFYKDDKLRMRYGRLGQWVLYPSDPTTSPNEFTADGIEDTWNMDLSNLKFIIKDGKVDRVEVSTFNRPPPVFVKGLKMSDAPPVPDVPPPQCKTPQPNGANNFTVIDISVMFIMMTMWKIWY